MAETVQGYELCRSCLARQGFRGGRMTDPEGCFICRGLSVKVDRLSSDVLRELRRVEFRTFSIGLSLPEGMQEREDRLRAEYKLKGNQTVKTWLSNGISQRVARAARRRVDKLHPDVAVLVDLNASKVSSYARPLFVFGRYSKPTGVPQRRMRCSSCGGIGCEVCGQTGYEKGSSVESAIQTGLGTRVGSQSMKFTWIGSEDAESVVKPPGRPFLVEVKNPRKRAVPRGFLSRTGKGLVRVSGLKVLPSRPVKLPSFKFKTEVVIESATKVSPEDLRRLSTEMKNVVTEFRRPGQRPAYKRVYSVRARSKRGVISAEIELDGGLPVKRLVSGESVSPSLSEVLKTELRCRKFDILKVQVGRFNLG